MANDTTTDLHDLLERERQALRSGALNLMAQLTEEKEHLMTRLKAEEPDRRTLDQLRDMAVRNSRLLAATRRGIETAQKQIAQIRSGGPRLNTYDSHGQRNCLNSAAGRLERRA